MRAILLILGVVLLGLGGLLTVMNYRDKAPDATDETAAAAPENAAPLLVSAPDPAASGVAPATQDWLIDRSGSLVDQGEVAAFLFQDRFTDGRQVALQKSAALSALLGPGETLPAQVFLQAFADIRAPALAAAECARLTDSIAAACAVADAGVIDDSVDPVAGTAQFRFALSYTLKPDPTPLPDPRTLAYRSDRVSLGDAVGAEDRATAEAWQARVMADLPAACDAARSAHGNCRITSVSITWAAPDEARAIASIGWLEPMPAGIHIVGAPGG